jgi:hypothetical protein
MSVSHAIKALLAKPFMAPVFFFSGVAYDTLTLTRIDRLQDNLLLLIYLLLLGVLIVLTGRLGIEPAPDREVLTAVSPFARWMLKARSYYPMASQFLLGGLFSAYAIFYSRSATLTSTAIFFVLLIVLLVGNEFLHNRESLRVGMLRLFHILSSGHDRTHECSDLPGRSRLERGRDISSGAVDLSQQSGSLEARGGRGYGACLRINRAVGRVLLPQLDSSRAALAEVGRDLSRGEEERRSVRTLIRETVVSSLETVGRHLSGQ